MHARVPFVRSWTLGAVFAFIAAALVAVFGITPAHAAGTARHAAGPSPAETLTAWSAPEPELTITAAAAGNEEQPAQAQPAAAAPPPVRTTGPAVGFAAPTMSDARNGSVVAKDTWGRAPPA